MEEPQNSSSPIPSSSSSISELIVSLEQATLMAKQLSSSTSSSNANNPTNLHQIHTSLHQAYNHLSAFLSAIQFPPAPENSVSSTNGAKTIQLGDDGEEETSKCTIDRVEQKLRDCFIKNKRPKRPLSPSVAELEEEKRFSDDGFVEDYDPHAVKLTALDFVCQFHD